MTRLRHPDALLASWVAELSRSPAGRHSVIDLGRHNGACVNGTRVSQQELEEGDIIAIGHAAFRLADNELIECGPPLRGPAARAL
jgi:ABC transport system ATP-binding/permease protein